jgi:hypothetical protein
MAHFEADTKSLAAANVRMPAGMGLSAINYKKRVAQWIADRVKGTV